MHTEFRSLALKLSAAVSDASRIVTEHIEAIDAIPEDRRLNDDPAAAAVELLAAAISDAENMLTTLRDRFGSPAWLSAEEGCEA